MAETPLEPVEILEAGSAAGAAPLSLAPGSPGWKPSGVFSELVVYQWMGEAVRSSIEEFLNPLQSPPEAEYVVKTMMQDEFLSRFATMANGFADGCCQKLVRIIHASSRLETVRQTPTPELAKRIRDSSFKPLDVILANYAVAVKKVEVITSNIRKIRDELRGTTRSEDAAALPGSPASSEPAEWATEEELTAQHDRLIQAKSVAYSRIIDFLMSLMSFPEAVLAYGCDKCFAGEVNFEFELEQVNSVKVAIRNKQANAVETLKRVLALTTKDLEQEKAFIVANIEQEMMHSALEDMMEAKMEERARGRRSLKQIVVTFIIGFVVVVLVVIWAIMKNL